MFGGIPFFGGMPGMHGMHGHGDEPDKEVDTTGLYTVLGVPKTASEKEIRKAYMNLAKQAHPDKGGDAERFKQISKAYEILSDPEKRALYDEHGEEGVESGGGRGDASSIFEQMFGGGGGRGGGGGGGSRRRKGEDIVHSVGLSLEDLYNGRVMKMKVTREVLCTGCSGSGCKAGVSQIKCDGCDGRGARVVIRQMGPMIQQMQQVCPKCRGEGKSVKPEDSCTTCSGKRTLPEKKVLEVNIEKGMRAGERIVFHGQSDEAPGMDPGDIIFTVQEAEHAVFRRQGCDLVLKKEITLQEALCGTRFVVDHLDGKQVVVVIPPGEVISPDDVKSVVGKGMPVKGNPFVKGDLFIKFEVAFPKKGTLTADQIANLLRALPGPTDPAPAVAEDVEAITVTEIDVEAARERSRLMRAEDSDEDGGGGRGQRVQCAQQ